MAHDSASPTPYELLGVDASATPAEITSAYRKAARRLHPDINPDADPAALAAVSDAYAVLSRPAARARYDAAAGAGGTARAAEESVAETRQDGLDVTTSLRLPAAEARSGTLRTLDLGYAQPCRDCAGSGYDTARLDRTCPVCDGVRMHPVTGKACEYCAGAGRVSDHPCPTCAGARTVAATATLTVTVPPGSADGTRVRLSRKGAASADGRRRGNVYVDLRVDPDPAAPTTDPTPPATSPAPQAAPSSAQPGGHVRAGGRAEEFQVAANGADVGLVAGLDYPELRLGATVLVADPSGRTHPVRVPAGTRPGDVLRVPGAGHRDPAGRRADLHVQVALRMPDEPPDAAERSALAAIAAGRSPRGWTHAQARRHTVVERLLERCASYAPDGLPCPEQGDDLDRADWCERCLAATRLLELGEH